MKQVNWGIIGLGVIASQFANGFKYIKNAKILGVASNNRNKIKEYREKYRINTDYCFDNYEDLIKNQDIDIIYIALPTSHHYEWIVKCLKSNKRVLVEKPATLNSQEALNIKDLISGKGNFFTEAFMYLYHPKIRKVLEFIELGTIGDLVSMESFFGQDILTKNFFGFRKKKRLNPDNRLYNKKLGGGVILDLGCYPVSFSTLIASLKSKINYNNVKLFNKKKKIGSTDVDLDSYTELNFENNFTSKIGASFTKNLGKHSRIIGTRGELIIEDTWTSSSTKIIIKKNNEEEIKNINSNENIYSYEIETISQCIIDNKTKVDFPGLTIENTVGNMKIIDEWLR